MTVHPNIQRVEEMYLSWKKEKAHLENMLQQQLKEVKIQFENGHEETANLKIKLTKLKEKW